MKNEGLKLNILQNSEDCEIVFFPEQNTLICRKLNISFTPGGIFKGEEQLLWDGDKLFHWGPKVEGPIRKRITIANNQLTIVRNRPSISKHYINIFNEFMNKLFSNIPNNSFKKIENKSNKEGQFNENRNFSLKEEKKFNFTSIEFEYTFLINDPQSINQQETNRYIFSSINQASIRGIFLIIKSLDDSEIIYDGGYLNDAKIFEFSNKENNRENYIIGLKPNLQDISAENLYFEKRKRISVLNTDYIGISDVIYNGKLCFENNYRESIELFFNETERIYQSFIQAILSLNHTSYTQGFIFAEEDVESNPNKAVFIFYIKDTNTIYELLKIVIDKSSKKIFIISDNSEELYYNPSKNFWKSNSYIFCEQGIFIIVQEKTYKLVWEESKFFDYEEL